MPNTNFPSDKRGSTPKKRSRKAPAPRIRRQGSEQVSFEKGISAERSPTAANFRTSVDPSPVHHSHLGSQIVLPKKTEVIRSSAFADTCGSIFRPVASAVTDVQIRQSGWVKLGYAPLPATRPRSRSVGRKCLVSSSSRHQTKAWKTGVIPCSWMTWKEEYPPALPPHRFPR